MPDTTVKKQRIGRLPQTETTIIEFDGIAFALNADQLTEHIAECAKSLNGIRINRQIPDKN
ncbi:hypothetical protein AB1P65_09590 [Roseibium alexandrii]